MRRAVQLVCLLAALGAAGLVAVALAFPGARARGATESAPPAEEREALLAALRPPKRARPLVAVVANNSGSETTDFIVPYGVLRASGAVDVFAVALHDAPVPLMPALRIRPQLDVAGFDRAYPEGADYVIVPAMHQADDPELVAWISAQRTSGATIVGVCDGSLVLAAAGLLDGRNATSHWFSIGGLRKAHPTMHWVEDRRYVVDRGVVTTTGVTASVPISLTLVEAIAGRERAEQLAAEFAARSFGAEHSSHSFALDRRDVFTAARNLLAFWSHDALDVRVDEGVDEVALAFTADAYSRTYRSSVRALSEKPEVTSRRGLTFLTEPLDGARPGNEVPLPPAGSSPVDAALDGIASRYGAPTADFVALQLEYERPVHEVRP